jgi:hypothetical protein
MATVGVVAGPIGDGLKLLGRAADAGAPVVRMASEADSPPPIKTEIGRETELFLPDKYYRKKLEDFAPGQSCPYSRHERFYENGDIKQVTLYDFAGDRVRQYDIGSRQRHGEGVHIFEYDSGNPRQKTWRRTPL